MPEKQNAEFRKRSIIGSSRAFSLMEILIVLALIALIAGVVIANLNRIFGGKQEEIVHLWFKQIDTPLMAYRLNIGTYPSTEEGLQALLKAPAGKEKRWKGPYIDKVPLDPWKNPYQYRYPGVKNPGKYDVWSWGPDGVESGDDIGNWEEGE